jgi:hypothetical protein
MPEEFVVVSCGIWGCQLAYLLDSVIYILLITHDFVHWLPAQHRENGKNREKMDSSKDVQPDMRFVQTHGAHDVPDCECVHDSTGTRAKS